MGVAEGCDGVNMVVAAAVVNAAGSTGGGTGAGKLAPAEKVLAVNAAVVVRVPTAAEVIVGGGASPCLGAKSWAQGAGVSLSRSLCTSAASSRTSLLLSRPSPGPRPRPPR